MSYLSRTVSVYTCPGCGQVQHDEVETDAYGETECIHCERSVRATEERPATYWSVAVYSVGRQYGGPEEGGWWYDAGSLERPGLVRGFEDYDEAEAYLKKLWDETPDEDKRGDSRVVVRGYTERLPEYHWPRVRPRYS